MGETVSYDFSLPLSHGQRRPSGVDEDDAEETEGFTKPLRSEGP
jgi:hypothetical protein